MVRVKDCYKTIQEYHRFNLVWLDLAELLLYTQHDNEVYQLVSYTQLALTKIKTH
jgi:hypothetical protein